MSDHTPGPWVASDGWGNFGDYNRHEPDAPTGQVSRFSYAVAAGKFVIAHCSNPGITCSSERSEANARLMAAAPELKQALQRMMAWAGELEELVRAAYKWTDEDKRLSDEAFRAGHTAVAHSEGRVYKWVEEDKDA